MASNVGGIGDPLAQFTAAELIQVKNQIETANPVNKSAALGEHAIALLRQGYTNKAIQVATAVDDVKARTEALSQINRMLASVPLSVESSNYDLKFMAINLAKRGDFVKAREIINSMPETGVGRMVKANALLVLNAMETTSPISDELQKSNALKIW